MVAEGTRHGADAYAAEILQALEAEATKALAGIRKGIEVLEDRRVELHEAAPDDDGRESDPGDRGLETEADRADERAAGSRSPLAR